LTIVVREIQLRLAARAWLERASHRLADSWPVRTDGVVVSRKYYEMLLENLSAAGETTRKFFAGKGD
jgi:hypothetical protein